MSLTRRPVLIFDIGGVLLDWNPRHLYTQLFSGDLNAMEHFLTEIDFYTWNQEQDKGRPFADGVAELSARFPEYADLIRAYDERWDESISGPIQSTVEILEPLKAKGYSLYGLTNWSDEKFQLVNHKYPFLNLFESVLVSGYVKMVKPDPAIFQMMLDWIGRPAEECIFIDDSSANVESAQKMGFQTIQYESTSQMLWALAQIEQKFDHNLPS